MTAPAPEGAFTVATAGPTDPEAGTRAKIYAGLRLIVPLLGFAATFGLLTQDQVTALNGLIAAGTAALGAFGLFGFNLATKNTKKQINNGTFDPAPQLPAVPALEQLKILRDATNATYAGAVSKAQDAADAIQAAASTAAKAIGVPDVVVDVADAGIDSLQDLLAKARKAS